MLPSLINKKFGTISMEISKLKYMRVNKTFVYSHISTNELFNADDLSPL